MNYLRRTERRFLALVLAIRAGTLRPLRPRPSREAPSGPSSNPGAACPDPRSHNPFPRTRAWLCLLMTVRRHIAAGIIGSLRQFLDDPEMVALIQAEPRRFGRLLRPLFRIDGNQIPVCLRLPKRERPKREPKQRLAKFRPMKAAEFPHSKAQTLQRLRRPAEKIPPEPILRRQALFVTI
jgi:hypothetical protein